MALSSVTQAIYVDYGAKTGISTNNQKGLPLLKKESDYC